MKLIEIKKEEHYIVVDDSEIKIGSIVLEKLTTGGCDFFTIHSQNDIDVNNQMNVAYSTQPLEGGTVIHGIEHKQFIKIKYLDLSEVEEAIYGYDVKKMAEKDVPFKQDGSYQTTRIDMNYEKRKGYIQGFKTALELVKDKFALSIDQIHKIIAMSKMAKTDDGLIDMDSWISNGYEGATPAYSEEEIIKSLLPKTEWDVEITPEGKIVLL